MPVDVSVIVVSYNVRGFLASLLRSIRQACGSLSVEVCVVDNHSTDGSVDMVRKDFPEVRLIENTVNVGFAAANNQALAGFRGRYACLVNPDALLQEDTLQVMVNFMETHPDVGVAGCKVLNPDGSLQLACRRSIPTPASAFFKLTGLSRMLPGSRLFGAYNLTYLDADTVQDVEAVSGSFMFVRRETIADVGLLDEAFFMYGEDLDWQYRIRRAGWRICYVPATRIVHYKGESAKRSGRRTVLEFYRAMYIFARKHRPRSSMRLFTGLIHGLITVAIVLTGVTAVSAGAVRRAALPILDLILVNLTPLLATYLRIGRVPPLTADTLGAYVAVHATYSAVWMLCFVLAGLYGRRKFSGAAATVAVTGGFIVIAAATYFFPAYRFSRAVLLLSWGFNILLIAGWRTVAANLIGAPRRAIILGADQSALSVHDHLVEMGDREYEVIGFLASDPRVIGTTIHGLTVLNGNGFITETLDAYHIDEVIVAGPAASYQDILHLVSACTRLGVGLKLVMPRENALAGREDSMETVSLVEVGGDPLATGQRMVRRLTKRLFHRA